MSVIVDAMYGCTICYSTWFLLKRNKGLFDFLKWGWVVLTCVFVVTKIFHWYQLAIGETQSVFQLSLLLAFLRKLMLERAQLPPEE